MRHAPLLVALLAVGSVAACSDKSDSSAGATGGPIAVKANDSACDVAKNALDAGTHVFQVSNSGSKVTEFYVYAAGDRVMGEIENITPGLSRELRVELPAGTYQTACKPGMIGNGIRADLTVSGSAAPLTEDVALQQATESYSRYITTQSEALVEKTTDFVTAVKGGDIEKSKQLFPIARTYYERIEPVAEIFGDLDPKIDGREDDATAELPFSGFHKLEKDLWVTKDISKDGPVADQLLTDVKEVVTKAKDEKLSPLQLANGAKELLDEVASSKITGEEDRYSHTDLWDFAANVDGSQAAVAALRPALEQRNPDLVKQIDTAFTAVDDELAKYRVGDGWKYQNELSQAQLKGLSDVINALAEPISKIAGVIAKK
ncbi:peptidase M75 family protein [Paractinoplanes ferrugineus]|uniref:Lipoprotein n=1 Tax=Paractinoplanes ferrugineus TaxID=113564 RepID=A0A919MBJ2_9ACTN|nr:iron uptake system protein EfeO [Actinoplanes ferrugineus]GIE09768.1 lipoprotein [Actinoplanes ferrugineus]